MKSLNQYTYCLVNYIAQFIMRSYKNYSENLETEFQQEPEKLLVHCNIGVYSDKTGLLCSLVNAAISI